jgi:hypothetical protein
MTVTIVSDEGKKVVYQKVTDLYVAVRQEVQSSRDSKLVHELVTSSQSWGPNVRELVKEVQQSLVELQDFLRSYRNGNPK